MALTPRGYPYPALTDAPSGPTQIEDLATAVDSDVQAVADARSVTAFDMLGRTTSYTVGTDTDQTVTLFDEGDLTAIGPNVTSPGSGTLRAEVDGTYRWGSTVIWDACGSGAVSHRREVYVNKNSAEPNHNNGKTVIPYPSGAWVITTQTSGGPIVLVAGDVCSLGVYQNSGSGLDILKMTFWLEWIGN